MIAALACRHGLSSGTFVSPHVREVTERFSVCGLEMTEGEFAEEYDRLLPYFDRVGLLGKPVTSVAIRDLTPVYPLGRPSRLRTFRTASAHRP